MFSYELVWLNDLALAACPAGPVANSGGFKYSFRVWFVRHNITVDYNFIWVPQLLFTGAFSLAHAPEEARSVLAFGFHVFLAHRAVGFSSAPVCLPAIVPGCA
jgi:hypothetical protein